MTDFYRGLHDLVRDIILVVDADTGRIMEVNRAAESAYQYTRAELLALAIQDLRVGSPQSEADQLRAAAGEGSLFEAVHRRKDGSLFPVEVSSRGETIGARHYLLSIIRDITERKRADEERERLFATTQQALAAREEFLFVASHELRTPIAIVSLQLHTMRRSINRGDGADRMTASVEAALLYIDRLNALVQRLLDATQLDSGLRLELAWIDLAEVTHLAVERVCTQTDAAGIEITVEVPEIHGRWDATRLEQVLVNLLSNALKYGLRRPVAISARVDIDVVHIEIRDHGIGLTPSETDRIFGKFERAVSIAHYGGLGLGLYISRQIVEAHRGWIEVESMLGRGSTFRVTLPLGEPP
jgi:PAS domain S-box-containing protein